MLIIWGWRAVNVVVGTGHFFCPRCRADTTYRHVAPRRWFTLFFLPIIPLTRLERYVECKQCRGAFVEAVLASPTTALFEFHQGLANRAAIAHLASLAHHVDTAVESAALDAMSSVVGGADYDRNRLHIDIRAFARPEIVVEYLKPLAADMTIEGREEFIRRAVRTVERMPHRSAAMDGAVESFAQALVITPAHLVGIRDTELRALGPTGVDQ